MKKIILYGVTSVELRRNIEFLLDRDWEIVGYSDTHYREDVLDGNYQLFQYMAERGLLATEKRALVFSLLLF